MQQIITHAYKAVLLIKILVLSSLSQCFASEFMNCMSLEELQPKVFFCSENTIAVTEANHCLKIIRKSWNKANAELLEALSIAQKINSTKQEGEYINAHNDLQKTLDKLEDLINETERLEDLVASYQTVMPDSPGSLEDSSLSSPCFYINKAKVQEIVFKIGNIVNEGILSQNKTYDLWQVAMGNDKGIEKIGQKDLLISDAKKGPLKHAKGKKLNKSDLTENPKTKNKVVKTKKSFSDKNRSIATKQISYPNKQLAEPTWINRLLDTVVIENSKLNH